MTACERAPETYQPRYSTGAPRQDTWFLFGVHPLHNPARLQELYGPITDLLSRRIPGARFRLEASRNYATYEEKLYQGHFHFALPNPYQTVLALRHGYRVFGKVMDDDDFYGIILVRKDSGIRWISDLKGKAISFPAPTALAATMMPQFFLQRYGLDVMHDIEIRYVGSQESSIMSVYLGDVAAAASWPPPWRALSRERPEVAEQLEERWQTPPLRNNGLVVRQDVPPMIVEQVGALLFSLHESAEGQAMLRRMELAGFETADDDSYQTVRDFLEQFNAQVRPVEH
ncbi:MAG: phosphonate ABC transporter substrate-binding protein [Desulfobulbaceae bacterium A2]|nr:MAG: phosphonate ABC transporter substrate-binding protein [Desulfobulbaceae bacterium A2]